MKDKGLLILPRQPYHDKQTFQLLFSVKAASNMFSLELDLEFIQTMAKIFHWSCWFGVVGSGRRLWRLWSLFLLIMLIAIEIGAIWKVIKALAGWAVDTSGSRSVTARLAGTMFYSTAITSLILSSKLASSWEQLSSLWISVERAMTINIPPDPTIKKRILFVTILMSSCALTEHVMSVISQVGLDCPPHLILMRYILLSHGFLLLKSDYSIWIGIPLLFMSNIATILWNFQDILIVLISMGLTSRYHRLNKYVAKMCAIENKQDKEFYKTEPIKVYTWRKIREAYVKQAMLVRKVDREIGLTILLSSFGNFYFICLQLFLGITRACMKRVMKVEDAKEYNGYIPRRGGAVCTPPLLSVAVSMAYATRPKYLSNMWQGLNGDFLKQLYYLVSLGWIIVRVSCMVLAAAEVNSHSKLALQYLHGCRFKVYNVEIDRLQNQLTKDDVSLSGMGFFKMNKSVLLQMAGAVVTYELVLIQFDNKSGNDSAILNMTKS